MSTSTIDSVLQGAIDFANSVWQTDLGKIITFAVGIILFFVMWRLFRGATHSH